MFKKNKVESIQPMAPFDAFSITVQQSAHTFTPSEAIHYHGRAYAVGFRIGETEIWFSADQHVTRAGFFLMAITSELGVNLWDTKTTEEMVSLMEAYFTARYANPNKMIQPSSDARTLAQDIAHSYVGTFESAEVFEASILNEAISDMVGLGRVAQNEIHRIVSKDKVREHIAQNYVSHNNYYFLTRG